LLRKLLDGIFCRLAGHKISGRIGCSQSFADLSCGEQGTFRSGEAAAAPSPADPVERIERVKAEDPHRRQIVELFETWNAHRDGRPIKAADLAVPM
jgi:hypothetical protein